MPDREVVDKWVVDELCEVVQDLATILLGTISLEMASNVIERLDRIREALGTR